MIDELRLHLLKKFKNIARDVNTHFFTNDVLTKEQYFKIMENNIMKIESVKE